MSFAFEPDQGGRRDWPPPPPPYPPPNRKSAGPNGEEAYGISYNTQPPPQPNEPYERPASPPTVMANVTGWTQKVAPVQYVTTPFQSVQYVTMKGPAPAAPPAQYVRYMPPAPQTQKVVRVMTPAPTHVLPKPVGLDFNLVSGQAPIIVTVEPGSPAFNAGLLPGDRILSVSTTKRPTGAETKGIGSELSPEQFSGLLKQTFHDATKAGGKVIVRVERGWNGGGVGWEFLAEIGNASQPMGMTTIIPSLLPHPVGLDFYTSSGQAPIIGNVEPGSPASNAGILPGDRILSVSSTKMPTRAETKGMSVEQFSGLVKQTFHDATKAGGKLILQVERGWNGGGVGWEFLAEVGNMQMPPPMTPSYTYMSAPPVTQTAPPMVQYVNGPGYADPYYAPAPSYLDYGYPSFDPSYGPGSEPGIHEYGHSVHDDAGFGVQRRSGGWVMR